MVLDSSENAVENSDLESVVYALGQLNQWHLEVCPINHCGLIQNL